MRKIDFYGQVVLLAFIVLTALLYYFSKSFLFVSLIGLFFLGIWQIISALTVTIAHHLKIYNRHIRHYWMACITMILIFAAVFLVARFPDKRYINWLFGLSTTGGLMTAFFYLYLYKKYFLLPVKNEISSKDINDGSLLTDLEIIN